MGLLRLAVKSACIAGLSGASDLEILEDILAALKMPKDQVQKFTDSKSGKVAYNSDGEVTEINMNSANLKGKFPKNLTRLRSLEIVEMNDNQLHGEIPELGGMKCLEMLKLARNDLKGAIPKTLGQLNQMILLDLGGNKLTGKIPPELGDLKKLRTLRLEKNELQGALPGALWNLSSLRKLALSNNHLNGNIGPLTNQPYLEEFLALHPIGQLINMYDMKTRCPQIQIGARMFCKIIAKAAAARVFILGLYSTVKSLYLHVSGCKEPDEPAKGSFGQQ